MTDNKRKKNQNHSMRVSTTIKHEFTNEEWKDRTDQLTRKMKEVELEEEQVKATAAQAKANIKSLKSQVNDMANDLRNGYTMAEVEATVEFNRKKGEKRFYVHAPGKPHNKSFIRVEAMTEKDYELLPLDGDAVPEPIPGPEALVGGADTSKDGGQGVPITP